MRKAIVFGSILIAGAINQGRGYGWGVFIFVLAAYFVAYAEDWLEFGRRK